MRGIATLVEVTDTTWVWSIADDFGTKVALEEHPPQGLPEDCYPLNFNGLAIPPVPPAPIIPEPVAPRPKKQPDPIYLRPRFSFSKPAQLLGRPGTEEYMWRWTVAKWLGLEAKFHFFRSSDPDDLHDHPWWFISFLLAGTYTETYERPDGTHATITRKAPSVAYRPALHRHSVQVPNGPALTFVIHGRRWRPWGFWPMCKDGLKRFVHWREYNGTHEC